VKRRFYLIAAILFSFFSAAAAKAHFCRCTAPRASGYDYSSRHFSYSELNGRGHFTYHYDKDRTGYFVPKRGGGHNYYYSHKHLTGGKILTFALIFSLVSPHFPI